MFNSYFKLSKYRFTLEAIDNISLPAYKGSTFHGGFGHALMQISPIWYRYFFEPKSKDPSWPKPFVILPPLDEQEHYSKGQQFHLELTLIGEATQHYAIAQAAVEYLGMQMGLGYEQGKYKVIDVINIQQNIQQNNPQRQANTQEITLTFPTRLRLKANNKLQKHTPEFSLFLSRLIGRLKTLQKAYMTAATTITLPINDYQDLLNKAKTITIKHSNTHWDDWDRFSGSQKKWMKFGGLVGDISYQGELQDFMDLLKLGEWLHVGGKTSFGLGKYEMDVK